MAPAGSRPLGLKRRPGSGPAVIAHSAGNHLSRVQAAIDDGADLIEVDLFVHEGRFEARHERAIYPLPFWLERWYLRRAPREPVGLGQLLRTAKNEAGVLLDLKNGARTAAALVRGALDDAGPGVQLLASSQAWLILRALRQAAPEVDLYYSIDVRAKLDLFLSVADRDIFPRGVSCRHNLLTPGVVARFKSLGLAIIAWTVDNPERAAELASLGVDGITTHRVKQVREQLAGEA